MMETILVAVCVGLAAGVVGSLIGGVMVTGAAVFLVLMEKN